MRGAIGPVTDPSELPGGIVVEARIQRGVSVVGRVIIHDGARVETQGDGAARLTAPRADSVHFAFYDDALLGNGRQPYDQFGIAYLPVPYAWLNRLPLPGYGALLVQAKAQVRPIDTMVMDDGATSIVRHARDQHELRSILAQLATIAGVPEESLSLLPAGTRRPMLTPAWR